MKSATYQSPKLTDFSIENILRKDFGRTIQTNRAHSQRPCHLPIQSHVFSQFTIENILKPGRATLESGGKQKLGSGPLAVSLAISPAAAEMQSSENSNKGQEMNAEAKTPLLWPAWVYCTRYSDRPSSGPRMRKIRARRKKDQKCHRTAFSAQQLERLRQEFQVCNYLTLERRRYLAKELNLSEFQIKIWFQNKRAKIKKAHGFMNSLAMNLMSEGLYNHSTIPIREGSSDETE